MYWGIHIERRREIPVYVICHVLAKMGEPKAERRVDKIFAKVIVVGDTG